MVARASANASASWRLRLEVRLGALSYQGMITECLDGVGTGYEISRLRRQLAPGVRLRCYPAVIRGVYQSRKSRVTAAGGSTDLHRYLAGGFSTAAVVEGAGRAARVCITPSFDGLEVSRGGA